MTTLSMLNKLLRYGPIKIYRREEGDYGIELEDGMYICEDKLRRAIKEAYAYNLELYGGLL